MKIKYHFLISLLLISTLKLADATTKGESSKITFGEATGSPGVQGSWSSARKVQVGTYNENGITANSPVWFSLAEGTLTEVYYPTIDQAQIKDSQFIVTDGKSFFQQERDLFHQVDVLSPSMVKITNIDPAGRYKISHTYFTLQNSSTVVDEVEVQTNVGGIHFYLLTNPQLNNTAAHDKASIRDDGFYFEEGSTQLRVLSSTGFRKKSVGFVGFTDGYQDLVHDYNMDNSFSTATNGNVASTGEINIPEAAGTYHFHVTYHFGDLGKLILTDYNQAKNDYNNSWASYLNTLKVPKNLTAAQSLLYMRSLYTLRCHEDKLTPGAFIASLSVPWGEIQFEKQDHEIGGYHLIWPRDLFNVSVALLNAGDYPASLRALRFLKKIQYKEGSGNWNFGSRILPKKGAWPQNTWVTGRTYWEGFQIDQTAFPVHLFYHILLKTDSKDRQSLLNEFQPMLTSALNFISQYGPWTHEERWEENFGVSPSSFSAAASALIIGSKIYQNTKYGQYLQDTADHWLNTPNDNIDSWTFTTNGTYDNGHYYLRIAGGSNFDAPWNPNDHSPTHIANSSQHFPQDKILDQGFLQLALLGLKPGSSPLIKASKKIVDGQISYLTPKGRGWYRYTFDAYGEDSKGRLWPLLSGEHGRFAIERFSANDLSWGEVLKETNTIISSFIGFANSGLMIPEQVFENSGEGTGSATPLAWAHAEYIKLLWSVENKHNVENILN